MLQKLLLHELVKAFNITTDKNWKMENLSISSESIKILNFYTHKSHCDRLFLLLGARQLRVLKLHSRKHIFWPHLQRPKSKYSFVSSMHFQLCQEKITALGQPNSSAPDPPDPSLGFPSWAISPFLMNQQKREAALAFYRFWQTLP